jgi:dUTP pyrophosphatase
MSTLRCKHLSKHAKSPVYSTPGSAAMDLYAAEDKTLPPQQPMCVSLDLAAAIPEGYVGLIKSRSGLCVKHNITAQAGVIDSDYRNNISVVLFNSGKEEYQVKRHDRIAQMLLLPCPQMKIEQVDSLEMTERGMGGFGSTGKR